MNKDFLFNYRLFVWMLLIMALILGGGYLIIAYSYNLQKETEMRIESARRSVDVAKEMEIELIRLRGFTFTYHVDKSKHWLDSIYKREVNFIIYLEQARRNANTPEEIATIQQISALFANYEQNIQTATMLMRQYKVTQANILLVHAAKDLIDTILDKCRAFILLNEQAEDRYELDIAKANSIILKSMVYLGISGIIAGLFLGWIIFRLVFGPINQLILQVRGASGETIMEKLKIPKGRELDELGTRIKDLIDRINKTQLDLDKNKQLLQYSNKYAILGKVAPSIAHEIRNPLAAIKMLVYSMKEEHDFPAEMKPDLDIIFSEIDRMEGFIKNFLKFAKPSDHEFKPVDPLQILNEVLHLLRPKLKKNTIEVRDNTGGTNILIPAEASHLKQLFINLIMNAIDVMPKGGTLTFGIKIHLEGQAENGLNPAYVVLSIEDTGPGIPEAILKNLFEPFVKGTEQGIGLGLSISQSIASFHKGWIEASNKPNGSGAIFSVFLPKLSV
jgi:two-component system, NtrC family, sensor histidine kinase HydH